MAHQFTPGPWRVVTEDGSIGSIRAENSGIDVAQAQQTKPTRVKADLIERKANAILIAKSPELLYVLERILEDLPTKRDWLDPTIEKMAREVIREATILPVEASPV